MWELVGAFKVSPSCNYTQRSDLVSEACRQSPVDMPSAGHGSFRVPLLILGQTTECGSFLLSQAPRCLSSSCIWQVSMRACLATCCQSSVHVQSWDTAY